MNLTSQNDTLIIKDLPELTAAQAPRIRKELNEAFVPPHKNANLHCDTLDFLDSTGLGVLISLHKKAAQEGGRLTLLHPKPTIVQLLELTRLHRFFDIVAA